VLHPTCQKYQDGLAASVRDQDEQRGDLADFFVVNFLTRNLFFWIGFASGFCPCVGLDEFDSGNCYIRKLINRQHYCLSN
jgi:hypothetical protein